MHKASWSEKLSLYEDWYNEDMSSLFGYLFYQTQNRDVAEDLTASTCLRALERLELYDPSRGRLRDWIFGIARNQFRDYLRSQRRRPTQVALSEAVECLIADDGFELNYDQKETMQEIIKYLETLSEREQEIIALRYGAGLHNQEIASMLAITSNHVAVLLRRAIGKLRDKMEARLPNVS
ncbi:MAG: sigma-70 family RNA polymerase sigma factor [Anaerolineae bacterium]|nr:sigma-70 family RNA polymerase sigma factor [Anaerolineae bacterium]